MMHESKFGDPLLLGLSAFIIAQTMLNLPNAHLVPVAATLAFMPAILICGGLIYFFCAVFDYIRGNTFGLAVNGVFGGFFTSLFLFLYFQLTGILKFGPAANTALGIFLIVWTILSIPFVFAAFRVHKLFGLLFVFVFFAFLGGALANLVGLNSAIGGWSGLISAAIGLYLVTEGLMRATAKPTASPSVTEAPLARTAQAE